MLAAYVLATLAAAGSAEPAAATPQDVRVQVDPATIRCNYNRLLPSADMNHVVVWRVDEDLTKPLRYGRGEFVVASGIQAALEKSDRPRLRSFDVLRRLEPVRWGAGGPRLYGRLGEDATFFIDLPDATIRMGPPLDPRWRNARLQATSYGDLSPLTDARGMKSLAAAFRGGQPIRLVATIDSSARLFLFDPSGDFKTSVVVGGRMRRRPENGFFLRNVAVDRDSGSLEYLGRQVGGHAFLPYARPLFDLDIGNRVGAYGLTSIQIDRGNRTSLAEVPGAPEEIASIKYTVRAADNLWALVDYQTQMRIIRIRESRVESFVLCRKLDFVTGKYLALEPALRRITRSEVVIGRTGHVGGPTLFGHLYTPAGGGRDLAVYLHGGPAGTLAEDNVPNAVAALAATGRSVLTVEYSGSIGGGYPLSQALSRQGFRALEQDLSALARWLRRNHQGRVALIGESFGGVPALIAARDHSDTFSNYFFVAPLLYLPEGPVIMAGEQLMPVAADSQREFEAAVFGGWSGRERFRAKLLATVQALPPSPRLHFFFGERDEFSSARHLPGRMRGSGSVTSYPGVSHQTLGINRAVWTAIREKLAQE